MKKWNEEKMARLKKEKKKRWKEEKMRAGAINELF